MALATAIFLVSLLWLLMGSVINRLERFWMTEPMLALLAGVIFGPVLQLIIIPDDHQSPILEWGARLTIAMALMVAALRFRHRYLVSHRQMLAVATGGGMLLMFLFSVLMARYLLGWGWPAAILAGAIVTPTDPVVSSSMISGRHAHKLLNNNVRSCLYFESGINDGLAFPLVAIGWMMVSFGRVDWQQWLLRVVLYENLLAVGLGALAGYGAGKLMHYAHSRGLMAQKTLLAFSIGLGMFVLTGLELLHMNGIIGVFLAGLLFNRSIEKNEDLQEEQVQVAIERLFTIPMFFLIGLVIPWQQWLQMEMSLLGFILGLLFLRRLPAFILIGPFLKQLSRWPRVLLLGWFGPMGLAALFYALLTVKNTGHDEILPVILAVVTASVIIHGLTSMPLSRWYHHSDVDNVEGDSDQESLEEPE